jgi:hypothetical protein
MKITWIAEPVIVGDTGFSTTSKDVTCKSEGPATLFTNCPVKARPADDRWLLALQQLSRFKNHSNLPLIWQAAVKDARAAKRNKWRGPCAVDEGVLIQ